MACLVMAALTGLIWIQKGQEDIAIFTAVVCMDLTMSKKITIFFRIHTIYSPEPRTILEILKIQKAMQEKHATQRNSAD